MIESDNEFEGLNEIKLQWVANETWVYSSPPLSTILNSSKALSTYLVFDGLDTFATIQFCGKTIGKTNNQFRQYTFDISSVLQSCDDTSEVTVSFEPARQAAVLAAAAAANGSCADLGCLGLTYAFPYIQFIRKKVSDFGSDFIPAFAQAGIWRSVRAVQLAKPMLHVQNTLVDLYRYGQLNNLPPDQSQPWVVNASIEYIGELPVSASVDIKIYNQTALLKTSSLSTTLVQDDGSQGYITRSLQLAEEPNLWWPVGYGNQTMYSMDIVIKDTQNVSLATITKEIGFRTIVLDQTPITPADIALGIADGNKWNFEINGHEIYCKGSCFVDPSAFWPEVTREQIVNLFESVIDGNQNMLRVSGIGVYLPEWVSEIADHMGIMLWHEFMFSDATTPVGSEFLDSVKAEADYQVRSANSHPSTALWAGGNEVELNIVDFVIGNNLTDIYAVVPHYESLYNVLLHGVFDNSRSISFLPSSVTNGSLSYNYSSATPIIERYLNGTAGAIYGNTDQYNYVTSEAFDSSTFPIGRFATEFGFQSMPSIQTWKPEIPASDLYFNSTTVVAHNHHLGVTNQSHLDIDIGNQTMRSLQGMGQMTIGAQQNYPIPPFNDSSIANFTSWIYTTQIFQSEFLRAQINFYRIGSSKPERQLGTLYWQLNDEWAAPTWSSIESSGRWKMLHYTTMNLYKPVIVEPAFNASTGILEVYVVSDLWTPVSGTANITWYDLTGKILTTSTKSVNVGPINATCVFQTDVTNNAFNLSNAVAKMQVMATSAGKSYTHESWFNAVPLKDQPLADPQLKLQYDSTTEVFTATAQSAVAAYVWLDHPAGVDGNFYDNGFWLLPGQPKSVGFKVKSDKTGGQWVNGVTIRSLWDNTQ